MPGLDDAIAGLGGGSVGVMLAVAVLLGLRHATDPDHLTAVAALIADDPAGGARRAQRLGLAWGLGHATTLFACGIPLVLAGHALPAAVGLLAEVAVGVLIVVLATRLLVRRRGGAHHMHPHRHGTVAHAHPHAHDEPHAPGEHRHDHSHAEALGRSPAAAYGIGLVHGVGGSAGVGILLVGAISGGGAGVAALALFAAATAVSMAAISTGFGHLLARGTLARHLEAVVPAMGCLSFAFGAWYALGAL